MNIAIVGNGRMGRTLDAVCARRDDVRVIGHVGRGGCESLDALDGLDALLSTVQMPGGIPVATVAINGSENAALLAAQILATGDEALARTLETMRKDMEAAVLSKDAALNV